MISIIGGGLSGLTLAYFLHNQKRSYQLFEAESTLGGKIETLNSPFGQFESGANTLFADDFIDHLIGKLGLHDEVFLPSTAAKKRYILKHKKFCALAPHPLSLFKTALLPWVSKLKIIQEWFKKPLLYNDINVKDFFTSHFDSNFCDYLLDPFIRGIYGAKPSDLDLELCFPQLLRYEQQYGSILKGLFKSRTNFARRRSLSFKGGLITLVKTLAQNLNLHCAEPVEKIERQKQAYLLKTSKQEYLSETIVFACPAPQAGQLLEKFSVKWANKLAGISYTKLLVIHLVFDKRASDFHFDGFGALYPACENLHSAGAIWCSSIFAQQDYIRLTVISTQAGANQNTIQNIVDETKQLYTLKQDPKAIYTKYWPQAIPVYNTYLKTVQNQVQDLQSYNLHFCANWVHRVSLVDCMKYAQVVASRFNS